MLLAYQQDLNPLHSSLLSTVVAALPVLALFWLLVPRRWLAPKAAATAALIALFVAVVAYHMPPGMSAVAFIYGALFGLLPVGWTIFCAMLLYNMTVETGHFEIVRRSIAGLSGDARIQAILIGFAFGAFLEGAAGAGTPVAICGAILAGLGFDPFLAAVLCLIANTSPVAYGGLATPIIVLNGVTDLPAETLSIMAGRQLPLVSFFIPLYMVKCMCSWKRTVAVWPALLVAGGSFAGFQFIFATIHAYLPDVVVYPMTDIGGGIFSLVVTAVFLKVWRPREEWHFDRTIVTTAETATAASGRRSGPPTNRSDGHTQSATALLEGPSNGDGTPDASKPLDWGSVAMAWAPYVLMSVLLLLTGLVRQREGHGPVYMGAIQTNYLIAIPALDGQSQRDLKLHPVRVEQLAALTLSNAGPLQALVNARTVLRLAPQPESAVFNFCWLTAPGTPVFFAALLSMIMLRMTPRQVFRVVRRTCHQMRIPIPTIACMLGLSYVTRYAGMDATLGYAFAGTGLLYPFFAPLLGWLGVFLTGTDAGSNALFGSLQKITATEVYKTGVFGHLHATQAQVLICTSNSTGGVMGKMIDAQSICVATAATNQVGREADIFKSVIWHSIFLAVVIGVLTALQAYVYPFTLMVPH